MAAISIVSYYTVSQLTTMAGSDNSDVINNQNHVVEALQGEHNSETIHTNRFDLSDHGE